MAVTSDENVNMQRTWMGLLSVLVLGVSGNTTPTLWAEEPALNLIRPDQSTPLILLGDKESPAEKFAAQELKRYLQKITGRDFKILRWGGGERSRMPADLAKPAEVYIAVGQSELTATLDTAQLGTEQYLIDVTSERLAIVGGPARQRGVLYGVYEVLERLGVRWYRPEPWGEHVPRRQRVTLSIGTTVVAVPDYEYRSTLAGGFQRYRQPTLEQSDQASLWAVRNRLNFDADEEPRFGGRMAPAFDHIYYQLIPVEDYFDAHPEYFCFYQGARRRVNPDGGVRPSNPTGLQLCLSNPDLQQLFASKIISRAQGRTDLDSVTFSISPNDGCPFCECAQCQALDDPADPESMSNRVCAFSNRVARLVARAVPEARLSLQAYSAWTRPPTIVERIEPNIVIHLCLINQWADYTKTWHAPAPNWNHETRQVIARWKQLGVSAVYTYEYWSGYGWQGPLPLVRTMADRIRNYRELNIRGIYNESHPHWGPQGLELYMCARLLWNPDLDLERELALYYHNYYGPAAAPMKAYHELLMRALEKHPYPVHSGGRGMHLLFTPKRVAELGRHLERATAFVEGQPRYQRRLAGVRAGYTFAERVSEILRLKKQTGNEIEMPGWPGRGYYLRSTQAERRYGQLVDWVRTFDKGDAVFDLAPDPPHLWYLQEDVLENAAFGFLGRESLLLKDF